MPQIDTYVESLDRPLCGNRYTSSQDGGSVGHRDKFRAGLPTVSMVQGSSRLSRLLINASSLITQ